MKNLDHYLENAIKNIAEDRKITRELLDDVVQYLAKNEENHRSVGLTAAKYVETLQRSNEQLVKVSTLIQKQQASLSDGLSDDDKADIFDMLQDSGEEDVE
jgi:F0F1-type ATP synthase membrane subunit b/b'